jgi:hypothetical protein
MTRKLTTLVVTLIILSAIGFAQTRFTMSNTQVVSIPFSFAAGSRTLPSGNYTLQVDTEKQIVLLRGENQAPLLLLANREELQRPAASSQLVFQRYGSHYVLKNVRVKASAEGEALIPGTLEKEIARNEKAAETVAVQVGTR